MKQTLICPLARLGVIAAAEVTEELTAQEVEMLYACVGRRCAWWVDKGEMCAALFYVQKNTTSNLDLPF